MEVTMPRYRIALAALALFALSAAPTAAAAQAASDDPAQLAAEPARQAACSPTATDGDQATAATRAGIPLTIEGTGQSQSLPFSLRGGAYTITWSTLNPSMSGSFIVLKSAEGPSSLVELMHEPRGARSSGETHIYDVKPGRYYLSVYAPDGWSVTFTPLAV